MKLNMALALTLLLASMAARPENEEAIAIAETATLSWLSLTDQGEYARSWADAASLFQAAISESDWARSLTAVRSPLGKLKSRERASARFSQTLPGAPDGDYVVFEFNTSFANKASALETVTAMKDRDEIWRVAGYYIK